MKISVKRLDNNPIIYPDLDSSLGNNINGPSLIKVPDWIKNPLGKYYLYFAHHIGGHIRLAYADSLSGPWKIYKPGVLKTDQTPCFGHIASPDVHVDNKNKEIRMYYHGEISKDHPQIDVGVVPGVEVHKNPQKTIVATSSDGISFISQINVLGLFYFRVFFWNEFYYALVMPGLFMRSKDGLKNFEQGPLLFTQNMRHSAVLLRGNKLIVFFSNAKDCPERIMASEVDLSLDWLKWKETEPVPVVEPEFEYEGGNLALEPSKRDEVCVPVRQLRDPAIYEENGKVHLLYSVAGEQGIGISEIEIDMV
jgi:hypothetical protein